MTTEAFLGSLPAPILDQLTTACTNTLGFPLEMRLGLIEDARTGAPPRMTWVDRDPGGLRYEDAPFAMPGMDLQWLECRDYDVHAWARSDAELSAMVGALRAQLDILFGPPQGSAPIDSDTPARPGYAMGGKPSTRGPLTDPNVAGSSYVVFPVTLKAFAPRRVFGSAPIVSTPVEIDLGDANGSDPAIVDND